MPDNTNLEDVQKIGGIVEAAFSEPVGVLSTTELREWCADMRKELIGREVQFAEPDWTWLHKFEALADALDALKKAQKGCGARKGQYPVFCGAGDWHCWRCREARESAIKSLTQEAS